MTIEGFAPAKINLTLHVTGQRADGYHLLDSLVIFADVGDRLWLSESPDMALEVTGPFAAGVPADRRNLAWRAAELAGWCGHIRIEKNLPHGAGIGGGSADAGAVLRALGHDGQAQALGADVPVCRLGRAARMQGVGEVLTPVSDLPPLYAVLVNPGVHVPTPQVFAALARKSNPPMPDLPAGAAATGTWLGWLAGQRNDLEPAASGFSPVIGDVLAALRQTPQCRLARMSGSGATCFGLYDDAADAQTAARLLQKDHESWWVVPAVLS